MHCLSTLIALNAAADAGKYPARGATVHADLAPKRGSVPALAAAVCIRCGVEISAGEPRRPLGPFGHARCAGCESACAA